MEYLLAWFLNYVHKTKSNKKWYLKFMQKTYKFYHWNNITHLFKHVLINSKLIWNKRMIIIRALINPSLNSKFWIKHKNCKLIKWKLKNRRLMLSNKSWWGRSKITICRISWQKEKNLSLIILMSWMIKLI